MKKLMHILFLSCLKATELIEKKLQFKLSVTDKLRLQMHKAMCSACTNYEKQSLIIEKSITNLKTETQTPADMVELKKIIVDNLKG
nr:hypothetical protein [Bacteroidota bacterium]